jgi:hypothetical protein
MSRSTRQDSRPAGRTSNAGDPQATASARAAKTVNIARREVHPRSHAQQASFNAPLTTTLLPLFSEDTPIFRSKTQLFTIKRMFAMVVASPENTGVSWLSARFLAVPSKLLVEGSNPFARFL